MNYRHTTSLLTLTAAAALLFSACGKKTSDAKPAEPTKETKSAATKAEPAAEKEAPKAAEDGVTAMCKKSLSAKCDDGLWGKDVAECEKVLRSEAKKAPKCSELMEKHMACMAKNAVMFCMKAGKKTIPQIKNAETICKAEEKAVDACMAENHYKK